MNILLKEKDKQIELVLVNIISELKRLNQYNIINNHNATNSNRNGFLSFWFI